MVSFLIRTERTNEKVRWPPSFAYTYMYMGILDVLRKKKCLANRIRQRMRNVFVFRNQNFLVFVVVRGRLIDVLNAINCQSFYQKRLTCDYS